METKQQFTPRATESATHLEARKRAPGAPSVWLVLGLLALHQLALTLVHYGLMPVMGVTPGTSLAVSSTIIVSSMIMLGVIGIDLRKPGRGQATLLTLPALNAGTLITMVAGLLIAQIPLGILALKGATVWQSGAVSHLAVGRALAGTGYTLSSVVLLIATVVIAPFTEEVLYRGYLLGALIGRIPHLLCALISAALFVSLHFEPANLIASLCLGLGAAVCALRTRSVLPGLAIHIASNAFGMWYATLG
ncbi:hypothetical protein SKA58_19535 [Sphingomonas sp. SKA58]|uniref:CPBP family intramembrane glutamic endopeptidase n=1 Tax=Sphingomonas sp. (strain SKA58) TaxID=314266 RepID=UPI0000D7A6F1|nr:CPBP family intramembrane glutamic endopeptidase [Sphingomonas sp. SKA58]EAT07456.1 hypothetical protein SKA58_19535 [Sphingomonas sp. SKA58]